jgi:hypothetical protein
MKCMIYMESLYIKEALGHLGITMLTAVGLRLLTLGTNATMEAYQRSTESMGLSESKLTSFSIKREFRWKVAKAMFNSR